MALEKVSFLALSLCISSIGLSTSLVGCSKPKQETKSTSAKPPETAQPATANTPQSTTTDYSSDTTIAQMSSKYLAAGFNDALQSSTSWNDREKSCIATVSDSFAVDEMQVALKRSMSADDFNHLNKFYATDLGKKYITALEQQLAYQRGKGSPPTIQLTPDEEKTIQNFNKTSSAAAMKRFNEDPSIKIPLKNYVNNRLASCGLPPHK